MPVRRRFLAEIVFAAAAADAAQAVVLEIRINTDGRVRKHRRQNITSSVIDVLGVFE